jgi:hypothetical protein
LGQASDGVATLFQRENAAMYFATNSTERMRIDSSGNVGIGTSSPSVKLEVNGSAILSDSLISTGTIELGTNGSGDRYSLIDFHSSGTPSSIDLSARLLRYPGVNGNFDIVNAGTGSIVFIGNNTERMRIDSSGNLIIGKTTTALGTVGVYITATGVPVCSVTTGTNGYQLYSTSSSSYRFYVNENGGVNNYSGNNVNLSDERRKTNIELSGSYLDKICSIPVKLFNYKDEAEGEQRTLGVIAQEVEAVAPELVSNDGWEGDEAEDGTPLKGIYTQDMMFALMKSIQEQQAIIQSQADTITAMEARLTALEGNNNG